MLTNVKVQLEIPYSLRMLGLGHGLLRDLQQNSSELMVPFPESNYCCL